MTGGVMLRHFRNAKGAAFYQHMTIYFAGFSLFSLVTGLCLLEVTLRHLIDPIYFPMYSVHSALSGASTQFMLLTSPLFILFSLTMAVSNIVLLRRERPRLRNVFALGISLLLILGVVGGLLLISRDFSGSEWENRIRSVFENAYSTVFVYWECMLAGSVISGITAARRRPAPDKDFIVILGCWFRKDGSLPPLLRGRVDRALDFWREQKEQTGKEALFIPSGGQGPDESMPEAEAMRQYLLSQDVPDHLIRPETASKNTLENMSFSKKIIRESSPDAKVVFSTTSYHVFRSGIWANLAGLPAEGIGSKTKWWYWPNAFMRETAGLLRKRWKQEILLLVVLLVWFGTLSMILG
jgi:vancomycin permeability regulator SanA